MNFSPPNQTGQEANNSNKAQTCDTNEDVHDDNVIPENLDAYDANE